MKNKILLLVGKLIAWFTYHIIKIVSLLLLTLITCHNITLYLNRPLGWLNRTHDFIFNNIYVNLKDLDGTIVTVAAIFIGIYFTIFSLLLSVSINSTLAALNKKEFSRILRYILFAFLSSFFYLLISIVADFLDNYYWFKILSIFLLIYMLLSALRFGIVMFLLYSNDFKKFKEELESIKTEQIKNQNTISKLDSFLNDERLKRQEAKNKELK